MATDWKSTWLHKVDQFGGQEPMGSGPFGATAWDDTNLAAPTWKSTWLHKVNEFGGQEPMGSGPFGATIWTEEI